MSLRKITSRIEAAYPTTSWPRAHARIARLASAVLTPRIVPQGDARRRRRAEQYASQHVVT
jgi:hypothetical protein